MQNRCPTLYEKKVGDGFDFPSDKSSVSFWTVRVGWVNQMLQSVCDGCWAQACPDFTPVQFDLSENTSFCTLALDNFFGKILNKIFFFFLKKLGMYLNGTRSFSQGYKNHVNFCYVGP